VHRRQVIRWLGAVTLLLAVGCSPAPQSSPDTVQDTSAPEEVAGPEPLVAVATVFPLAWLAEATAPDADVRFLGGGGQDPHDLDLSPGERALLETADIVLYLGPIGFQPQVEATARHASGQVVAAADVIADRLRVSEDDHAHDHDREDAHDHDREAGDDHGFDVVDPHIWFDATAMAEVATAVAAAFAAADPAGADVYRSRAAQIRDDLVGLDDAIDQLLDGCARDTVIVSHEAYAYLLEPRGLTQIGISGTGGHAAASPQRLAELSTRIRAEAMPAVLTEPVEGRADAAALASEAGVPLLEIHPLETVTDEQAQQGYPALLREQAETFAKALECRSSITGARR
jgi:zinc transport system substrate-binding protein